MQNLPLAVWQSTQPGLEQGDAVDLIGDAPGIETVDDLFLDQYLAPPRLGLEVAQPGDQFPVVPPERRPGVHIALGQAKADEDLARLHRVDRPVVDLAPRHNRHAVQGHLFICSDLPDAPLPARRRVAVPDQMPRQRLDPLRLDSRDPARIQPGGLHHLRSHQPFRLLPIQTRTRKHEKPAVARTQIVPCIALRTHSNVAEQAAEQSPVQRCVVGVLLIVAIAQLVQLHAQLHLHIVPFTHPRR